MGLYDRNEKYDLNEYNTTYSENTLKTMKLLYNDILKEKLYISDVADRISNFEIKQHIVPITLLVVCTILSFISTKYAVIGLCLSLLLIVVKFAKVGVINENKGK